ncbi:MAG: histidinol-phosphate transaminase [Phycisphaerae bacterium]|nr:histidinol-phosphate transaminase [Phycisphaerae bacterium]NIW70748.1 histidinol-phosphate transaminase [candidate division KSB1 bacterium]NIP51497.1 histidinol-phosphate transaminase [Phycisphaerae bacterium]NIS50677.1 histidinol-phosphate transaminase [Phycisphaerae bacterium]NIU08433.1 histidinol-phosphate transaminase [Phycisphaerae bacterium]
MSYFRENIEQAKGYQPGFQPKQTDVLKLNTNENPYPPSPKVLEVLNEIKQEQLRRYPDPVGEQFRLAAAKVHGLSPDNIMCCNGGDELLTIALRAFCDRDRPVAYPVPTYSLYPVLANLQNCKAVEVPFDTDFTLPPQLAAAGAALTIVCNPNAPSATFIPVSGIASLADELNGVLLIDEAYIDFAEDNCLSLVADLDNVIILRSMSKGYGLAGLRFGYAVAPPPLIAGLMKVKDSYNVNAIAIALATAAIKDQSYFRKNVETIKKQRKRLAENLRALNFEVPESSTNFLLAKSKDGKAGEIYDKLVQRNIYVRYFDLPTLSDKLRITVGTGEQNDKLVSALKEILSNKEA